LIAQGDDVFLGQNQSSVQRIYTLVPIEDTSLTVIGVWRVDDGPAPQLSAYITPAVLPMRIWIESSAVAMLLVYKLVLRHTIGLRKNMAAIDGNRQLDTTRASSSMPNELQSLAEKFDRMTNIFVRDEVALENSLREKNVLKKEVHHRVKNNLQLIPSIMNMKIRLAKHEETRTVLSRLQDRVRKLETIHRDRYQSQLAGLVDVHTLMTEVIEMSVEVGEAGENPLIVDINIDRVLLYPDQAVPLSLLTAEGITNAMQFIGAPIGQSPFIQVTLRQTASACVLTITNSFGSDNVAKETGLGAQLINAFAIQLSGMIELEKSADSYTLSLRSEVSEFMPNGRDF
jgi:two-component sensor histidine kinase